MNNDLAQLQELCRRFGASPEQAETMARQLIKRATMVWNLTQVR